MNRTDIDFHEELSRVEESKKEDVLSVLEKKLQQYEGQFVILSELGEFYSEILCLCGTPHLTVYASEETARKEIEAMPEVRLKYFKNAKVHQLNADFFENYRKLSGE
ncbi:hypothetical protein HZA97_09270 [Candidatus Woesearchaeota archaeon]|nr:hypothetical protein [Candidatus Woesearchaeota archaeon]